jgi:hypothetical protein
MTDSQEIQPNCFLALRMDLPSAHLERACFRDYRPSIRITHTGPAVELNVIDRLGCQLSHRTSIDSRHKHH